MRVYFAHSKEFDFINEYYKPIEDSENLKDLALLFPHKISDESRNGRDFTAVARGRDFKRKIPRGQDSPGWGQHRYRHFPEGRSVQRPAPARLDPAGGNH